MPDRPPVIAPVPMAVAGALCVSTSAVMMKLAGTSASVTAAGRCLFALPVLWALAVAFRRRSGMPGLTARERGLAWLSGLFLAADLVVWSHAIAAIGAGLGTVVPNLQVLVIALIGWLVLHERPDRSLLLAAPVMLTGLLLVGGLIGGGHIYGADPPAGIAEGVAVAVLYAVYILALRRAGRTAPVAALLEATLAAAAGSVLLGLAFGDFRLGAAHAWPALGWLLVLALTSQVLGWLLITTSMPRLPAWLIGVILLLQPAGSVTLGYLVLGERPSGLQFGGVALMLTGVFLAVARSAGSSARSSARSSAGLAAQHEDHPPGAGRVEGQVGVEVAVAGHDREAPR